MIERVIGNYLLQQSLGKGADGEVYCARQQITGQRFALKLLDIGDLADSERSLLTDRFHKEMTLCATIAHPNVVTVFDSGSTQRGELYTVFELVEGQTLQAYLHNHGPMTFKQTQQLMIQILDAFTVMHAAGIVHCDLKPANLMVLDRAGSIQVKLLDFGMSNIGLATRNADFQGTPGYAAPEQLRDQPVTPRTDLFSWGLVYLECLTARTVLPAADISAWARALLSASPVPVPAGIVNQPLGGLLAWVLDKRTDYRANDATLVQARLASTSSTDEYLDGSSRTPAAAGSQENLAGRRQVTALCLEMDLNGDLDEQTIEELLFDLQTRCEDLVAEIGGHIEDSVGDRLMVYFGYPTATDADARLTARTILDLNSLLQRSALDLNPVHHAGLIYRMAVRTDTISLQGDGARRSPVGVLTRSATRLCSSAPFGECLIDEISERKLANYLSLEAADEAGRFRVLGEHVPLARSNGAALIGRQAELASIKQLVNAAGGGLCLIQGDAGMGKSRLVAEFNSMQRSLIGECTCLPETRNSPLHPVLTLLRNQLSLDRDSDSAGRLESALKEIDVDIGYAMAVACGWFNLNTHYPPVKASPQLQKEVFYSLVTELLKNAAAENPASLLVIEDLHWADPSTLEYLSANASALVDAGVLLVATSRSDMSATIDRPDALHINLAVLDQSSAGEMIDEVDVNGALDAQVRERIIARSDGIPLFIRELTLTVLGGDSESLLDIPMTLRDLLAARLDRLGTSRETAQCAAVLGREFDYDLLAPVCQKPEAQVMADIDQLISAGVIHEVRRVSNPVYYFHHNLLAETAYDSLMPESRKKLHLRVAETLVSSFPDRVQRWPGGVANHFAQAEVWEQACQYGLSGALGYLQNSNFAETITQCRLAIEWAAHRDPGELRALDELRANGMLSNALFSTMGYSHAEVGETARKIEGLIDQLPQDPNLRFQALWSPMMYYTTVADYQRTEGLRARAYAIAEASSDQSKLCALKSMDGHRLLFTGEFADARRLLTESIELYDNVADRDSTLVFGHDSKVGSYINLLLANTATGDIEQAMLDCDSAFTWADHLGYPHNHALATTYQMGMWHMLKDREQVLKVAREARTYYLDTGQGGWTAFADCQIGWATGNLDLIRESLTVIPLIIGSGLAYWHLVYADALFDSGEYRLALEVIDEWLAQQRKVGELQNYAWYLRLKAACLLGSNGDSSEAIAFLEQSVSVARKQGANWYLYNSLVDMARVGHNSARNQQDLTHARLLLKTGTGFQLGAI